MNSVILQAPAKINLYLGITGRRPDGYHLLETWMQKLDLYDELEIVVEDKGGIVLHCPGSDLPEDGSNLAAKAAELFLQTLQQAGELTRCGVEITLRKKIPVAAGLGGGSSDAAAVLTGLNMLTGKLFSVNELCELGVRLGADVPFFVRGGSAYLATGIGEVLKPVAPLDGVSFVLVNPGFSVSTKWAYEKFALTFGENGSNLERSRMSLRDREPLEGTPGSPLPLTVMYNDLEEITAAAYPEIDRIKEELIAQGANAAMMSGSGPTVFAVFNDRQCAEKCCRLLKGKYRSTFVASPLG